MNIYVNLSMETLALIKAVLTVFKTALQSGVSKFTLKDLPSLINKVQEMVMRLPIPSPLQRKVFNIIDPIREEIKQYIFSMYQLDGDSKFLGKTLSNICFTFFGTVDFYKSAAMMLQDRSMTVHERYMIACTYCFEDEILHLRKTYSKEEFQGYSCNSRVLHFWNNYLDNHWNQETMLSLNEFCQKAFLDSIMDYNVVAAQYFWNKMPKCRERSLLLISGLRSIRFDRGGYIVQSHVDYLRYRNIVLFLLSNLDTCVWEQLKHPLCAKVLSCLHFWPYQNNFLELATAWQKHLPEKFFRFVIERFVGKIEQDLADYDYVHLLKEMLTLYSKVNNEGWVKLFPKHNNVDEYFRKCIHNLIS